MTYQFTNEQILNNTMTFKPKVDFDYMAVTTPSRKNVGYVNYSISNFKGGLYNSSKKPVKPDFVIDFLNCMLKEYDRTINDFNLEIEPFSLYTQESNREKFIQDEHGIECVYFITAGEFVKIGKSTGNPNSRLKELQTGCPYPMKIAAYVTGGFQLEHEYHRKFNHLSIRKGGEWFHHTADLKKFINSIRGKSC